MAWEVFKRGMRPSPKDPMVTLSASGLIGLNAAVTRNILGENRYALLLFDRDRALIGIKLLKSNEPDAYPIKCTKTRSHGTLTGTSFLKTYGIFPSETRAYPAKFDAENRVLVVDISESVAIQKRAKRKDKA